jgi:hypothetical protein
MKGSPVPCIRLASYGLFGVALAVAVVVGPAPVSAADRIVICEEFTNVG